MKWTSDKPTASGWYWYREAVKNMGKPMAAWVYNAPYLYVCLCPVQDADKTLRTTRVTDQTGEWWGPVEIPD